ncbi:hypothetical protein BC829DRAFT_381936 [Chytridium lagenaria]|nr:hypothetical protein BC829DRAFT_381936 [Chytridium lagenaria]
MFCVGYAKTREGWINGVEWEYYCDTGNGTVSLRAEVDGSGAEEAGMTFVVAASLAIAFNLVENLFTKRSRWLSLASSLSLTFSVVCAGFIGKAYINASASLEYWDRISLTGLTIFATLKSSAMGITAARPCRSSLDQEKIILIMSSLTAVGTILVTIGVCRLTFFPLHRISAFIIFIFTSFAVFVFITHNPRYWRLWKVGAVVASLGWILVLPSTGYTDHSRPLAAIGTTTGTISCLTLGPLLHASVTSLRSRQNLETEIPMFLGAVFFYAAFMCISCPLTFRLELRDTHLHMYLISTGGAITASILLCISVGLWYHSTSPPNSYVLSLLACCHSSAPLYKSLQWCGGDLFHLLVPLSSHTQRPCRCLSCWGLLLAITRGWFISFKVTLGLRKRAFVAKSRGFERDDASEASGETHDGWSGGRRSRGFQREGSSASRTASLNGSSGSGSLSRDNLNTTLDTMTTDPNKTAETVLTDPNGTVESMASSQMVSNDNLNTTVDTVITDANHTADTLASINTLPIDLNATTETVFTEDPTVTASNDTVGTSDVVEVMSQPGDLNFSDESLLVRKIKEQHQKYLENESSDSNVNVSSR